MMISIACAGFMIIMFMIIMFMILMIIGGLQK